MATTSVINTTLMNLYVNDSTYKAIGHSTDASLSLTHEPRDITTKDSGGYRELLEGLRSISGSGSFLFAFDATYGFEELHDAWAARSTLTVRYTTNVSGDEYYQFDAYISSLESTSSGAEDNVSFSVTLEGTGQLTVATLT